MRTQAVISLSALAIISMVAGKAIADSQVDTHFRQSLDLNLKISDDDADGFQTEGRIVFYRRAEPPQDRYTAPFRKETANERG